MGELTDVNLFQMFILVRRRRPLPLFFCSLFACVAITWPLSGVVSLKTFVSETYGFSVRYPGDWYLDKQHYVFEIENFPPSRSVRATLPPDGAAIVIVVPARLKLNPRTLSEFIAMHNPRAEVIGKQPLTLNRREGALSIVEVRTRCCLEPPYEEWINWYFEIEGHFFAASLGHRERSPDEKQLIETLKQVVLSLRLDKSSQGKNSP